MKKFTTWILTLIILSTATLGVNFAESSSNQKPKFTDTAEIIIGSNEIYHNDQAYLALSKNQVIKGTTYVSLRALCDVLKLNVHYDGLSKTFTLTDAYRTYSFVLESSTYTFNGQTFNFVNDKPLSIDGVLMMPLKQFTAHYKVYLTPSKGNRRITMNWNTFSPSQFSIKQTKIHATQTQVSFVDEFSKFSGKMVLDELWTGRFDVFPEAGTYTITRSVLTDDGVWQPPYALTVEVLPKNQPPVAEFKTNKEVYRIGEPIKYYDYSSDPESTIANKTWTNNAAAFFEKGKYDILLKVTDDMGQVSETAKTIEVTDEIMYSRDEFNKIFTPVGEKYTFQGSIVPSLERIRYTVLNTGYNLFRSNSPESAKEDGIYYEDVFSSPTRVLIHHLNLQANPVKYYLIASNPTDKPISFTVPYSGVGGPHKYITITGKISGTRYLESLEKPNQTEIILKPNEKKIILTRMSSTEVPNMQTISAHADVYTKAPLKLQMVILDSKKDVLENYDALTPVARDAVHRRGTFDNATKRITITERVGDTPVRLSLSDGTRDIKNKGVDAMTGDVMENDGIYGVVHEVILDRVAPNTVISINARGGAYSGSFRVNGKIIEATKISHLTNSNEAVILHRTGNQEERVEIYYIPASGSSLPLALLLDQIPKLKS